MFIKRTPVALALVSALFSAGAGAAAISLRPVAIDVAPQQLNLKVSNPLVAADGTAAIIIILKGDPAVFAYSRVLKAGGGGVVAQTSANSAAHTAIASLQNAQASFVTKLKAAGVQYTEIYRIQRVLNGIAVRMKPEDMAKVRALPNVERVSFLPTYQRPDNIASVPFVKAPQVWAGASGPLGLPFNAKGEGIKIGDIDTGLDFIHPDFGGTGLLANYQDVDPTSVIGLNSHNIIFPTSKVVGGTDFAGDAYDASNAPQPDPNPMDCGGHGSHTAGTIAGLGVNSDGTPYTGIYNPVAPYAANLKIGPGMAPGASLYALRVFGCGGSTNLVAQAIDWATDPNGNGDLSDRLDVINMSLGSPTGLDIADAGSDIEAVNNAALAGMMVVSSAGNSGDTFFIAGSPGAANVGISAAASVDSSVPGVVLTETAPVAEGFIAAASGYTNPANPQPPAPANQTGNVVLVLDATGSLSKGCTPASGPVFSNAAAISGNFALIDRGTCSFVQKVHNAQAAGATGVIIADNTTSPLPINMGGTATVPDGPITIPGVSISKGSGTIIKGQLAGATVTVTTTLTAASAADTLASFSSRGPVTGAGGVTELKPDIAAPGLNIPSVQTGYTCTGTSTTGCITPNASGFIPGGAVLTISGTSMAAPHITGLMALLRQLNPTASVEELKAMAINGAAHDVTLGANATPPLFGATRVGAGRIDAAASASGKVIAFNQDVPGAVSVTFDVEPVGVSQATHTVKLENRTAVAQTVTLSLDTKLDSAGVSFSLPSGPIVVPASGSTAFVVTMNSDTSLMKWTFDPTMATTQARANGSLLPRHYLAEESALIKVLDGSLAELARLPVYAATRPHSTMATAGDLGSSAPLTGTTNLTLSGQDVCTGTRVAGPSCTRAAKDEESFVSAFELQLTVPRNPAQLGGFANLHYFGVNSQPDVPNRGDYFFGIAAYSKWGTPKDVSYNVCIDSNNDGNFDKIVSNTDLGTFDQVVGGTTQAEDTFIALIYDNVAGTVRFDFPLNLATAAQLDTGALSNNTMILGATGLHMGLAAGTTKFKYGIAVCPGYAPLCGADDWVTATGTPNCGVAGNAFASFNGPFTYDSANPGVDGQGNVLDEDLNGGTFAVNYDVNKLVANGSNAMLLLHSHNTAATAAQVVVLDRIFADGFGN